MLMNAIKTMLFWFCFWFQLVEEKILRSLNFQSNSESIVNEKAFPNNPETRKIKTYRFVVFSACFLKVTLSSMIFDCEKEFNIGIILLLGLALHYIVAKFCF